MWSADDSIRGALPRSLSLCCTSSLSPCYTRSLSPCCTRSLSPCCTRLSAPMTMPINSARAAPLRTELPYEMPPAALDALLDRSGMLRISRDVVCTTSADGLCLCPSRKFKSSLLFDVPSAAADVSCNSLFRRILADDSSLCVVGPLLRQGS